MAIELAHTHALPKPWGVEDLRPWNNSCHDGGAIGEIWYERPGSPVAEPALLLKLLFTSQPLSIQVHPDDAFAHSMGLPNGKTEAWYVLDAVPEAKVALGLQRHLTPQQLREAVTDGSISDLVHWQSVTAGDVIHVPAGTIHAIGAGLVIAEIQQRSDTTFRLFDHGRKRELHVERAIAVAIVEPAEPQVRPSRLADARTLLVANAHFVLERIDLGPGSAWRMDAQRETWLLVLAGDCRAGSFDLATGDAIFVQADRVDILAGPRGMAALAAYAGGGADLQLLRPAEQPGAKETGPPWSKVPVPTVAAQAMAASAGGFPGASI